MSGGGGSGGGGGGGGGGSAAIAAIGNIVAGFGAFQQSRARAAQLKQQAKQARGEASMDAQMVADEGERAGAAAAVQGAASGGGFGGSFASVLEDLQRTAMFNTRSAIFAGEVEARNRLYEAKVAKQEGNFALLSSVLQASSTVGGNYMQQAEQRKQGSYRKDLYKRGSGR